MLVIADIASASQSLVPSEILSPLIPPANFPQPDSWRIEAQLDHFVAHTYPTGLIEFDSAPMLWVTSDPSIIFQANGCAELSLSLGSSTAFRILAQRNTTSGLCTLETWDESTGQHHSISAAVTGTVWFRYASRRFTIGSFYESHQVDAHIGMLRWYSTNVPVGTVPPRYLASGYGDMVDYEFEGNSYDLSGRGMTFPADTYATTTISAPVAVLTTQAGIYTLNGAYIASAAVGTSVTLDASTSFSNSDAASATCVWTRTSGPAVTFSDPDSCMTRVTPSAFGTAVIHLAVTNEGGTSTVDLKLGGVFANAMGIVDTATEAGPKGAQIATITGPLIRLGANPWSWADDRSVAMAALQISQQSTIWKNFWSVASTHGTLSIDARGNTVVLIGSGTQFQMDFCGGSGNTSPVAPSDMLAVWYPAANPAYAGQTGRWFASVVSCDSQTHLTLDRTYYPWAAGTGAGCPAGIVACGLHYSVGDRPSWNAWTYGNTPGNYYDNVLAFYSLYYRSGIDDFLNAARYLADAWWTGYANKMEGYYKSDGTYASQPRQTGFTGLMLWGAESGADVWPGLSYLFNYFRYLAVGYPAGISWNTNSGDLREDAYMLSAFGLCALYDPNGTDRATCLDAIHQTITHIWTPLKVGNTWPQMQVAPGRPVIGAQDGSVYVTVTDGSPNITAHGAAWAEINFSDNTPFDLWVWFCNDCWGYGQFGLNGHSAVSKNSDIGGDAKAYRILSITDSTHAVLADPLNPTVAKNYQSDDNSCASGCNKTMEVSSIVGFGQLPYMHGMLVGTFGTYVYQALLAAGPTYAADLTAVRKFVADGVTYLQGALDPLGAGMWGSMDYLSCAGSYQYSNSHCAPGTIVQGEAMRGYSAGYALAPTAANKAAADAAYNSLWAKPGFTTPLGFNGACMYNTTPLDHCYLLSAEDGDFMLTPGASTDNKWYAFYWGYGFGAAWPAVRVAVRSNDEPMNLRTRIVGTTSMYGHLAP